MLVYTIQSLDNLKRTITVSCVHEEEHHPRSLPCRFIIQFAAVLSKHVFSVTVSSMVTLGFKDGVESLQGKCERLCGK